MRLLHPKRSRRAGYSIVEVLVAATVLMVGVTGTMVTNVAASNLTRTSEETEIATVALTDTLERMRLLNPDDVSTTFPENATIPIQGFALENLQIVPTFPGFALGDGVITIRLTASWTTYDGGTRSIEITTAV